MHVDVSVFKKSVSDSGCLQLSGALVLKGGSRFDTKARDPLEVPEYDFSPFKVVHGREIQDTDCDSQEIPVEALTFKYQ